jgi:hypothetical protein
MLKSVSVFLISWFLFPGNPIDEFNNELNSSELNSTYETGLIILYYVSCGVVPDDWKLANIVPMYKKTEKDQVENYRPISLLSIISKVLERCVLRNIRDHLVVLINNSQHGFIPGKSCTSKLVEVHDCIGSLLDAGKQTDVHDLHGYVQNL